MHRWNLRGKTNKYDLHALVWPDRKRRGMQTQREPTPFSDVLWDEGVYRLCQIMK